MVHQRSIVFDARGAPYKKLLCKAREVQRKLRQLMPPLMAPLKDSEYKEDVLLLVGYETFAEELEKVEFSEFGHSDWVGRRVWEPGARELAGVYREIVNPNTGWSRNGPAVWFVVEALRRAYPGSKPTAAALETLLARRGVTSSVIRDAQWVLDQLRPKGTGP